MANELDEMRDPAMAGGNDVHVIGKQLPVTVGTGSKVFDVIWWFIPPVIGGVIWMIMKRKAKSYFSKLQQKIQQAASQIDNYLEQRVQILKNCAKLVDKAITLDETVFTELAKYRSGNGMESDESRNEYASSVENINRKINVAVENYPDLRAHSAIADAMQQNSYLQREITAAREVYNDAVGLWNRELFAWPTKQIVAAKEGYTTRIPFAADAETRAAAREVFF